MAHGRVQQEERTHIGSYYTYGNVAYELAPQSTWQEEEEEARKRAARAAEQEERELRLSFAKTLGIALVLFIGCIALVGMHVIVDHAEVSLRRQKSALEDLKAANDVLEAEMTAQLDLDYIKQEATERLGMREPQSYQMVYIDVPKQSYTVQYDTEDRTEEVSLWGKLLSIFKKDG